MSTAEEFYARAQRAVGPDGRLHVRPDTVAADVWPFEGDLVVKPLRPPEATEAAREGEDPGECRRCLDPELDVVWSNERWVLVGPRQPFSLPLFATLEPRAHHDLGDLPDDLAAEMGVLLVRLERAISALPGVARVHLGRWGDGGAHLHVAVMARPFGFPQLRGNCLLTWDEALPPTPAEETDANLRAVAEHLVASHGGRAHRS